MRMLLACLLVNIQILFGQDDFSLVNLTEGPWSRVHGSVNVITGNWVDQTSHSETTGPDPYALAHSYVSASEEEGSLADGWDFFHPSELEVFQPEGITFTKKVSVPSNDITIRYRDSAGATITFVGSSKGHHFHPVLKNTGYVFTNSIATPNRRDHGNTTIEWVAPHDRWVVTLGDGTKRIYTKKYHQHLKPDDDLGHRRYYRIHRETLPSGNHRLYSYEKDDLASITTLSSDEKFTINTIEFTWKKQNLIVTTSDNITTTFCCKKLRDSEREFYVVDRIFRSDKGDLSYIYSDKTSRHVRRITSKMAASGRSESILFYHGGKNHISTEKVKVGSSNDFLLGRVKQIWTNLLPNEKPRPMYSFFYKEWEKFSKTMVKTADGSTFVYVWDKKRRPIWVSTLQGTALLSAQRFQWGKDGELLSKTVLDEHKEPIFSQQYFYDDYKNVIKEVLRGSFSEPAAKLYLDKEKCPHGGETVTKEAQYDSVHRKIAEKDALGNWTYYTYDSEKDLLIARFTCEGTSIQKREFFSYDTAAVLIESIVDNGSSRHKENLHAVTLRSIDTITPRTKCPNFGAPLHVVHKVWTPKGLKTLQTELFSYDANGDCTKKELLDSAGNLQKTWSYLYDAHHRLMRFTDPSGRTEKYSYDNSGRRTCISTSDRKISYTYDLFDRVILETTTYPDGSSATLSCSHNLTNTHTVEKDFRGRQTVTTLDPLARPIKTQAPSILTDSGIATPTTTVQYVGSLSKVTSPSGATTTTLLSSYNKPLHTTLPSGAIISYRYDKKGRLCEQKDPTGLITTYEYDIFDRPITVTQKGDLTTVTTRRYDGLHLVEERTPTTLATFSYDEYGRKSIETHLDLLTKRSYSTRTEYDTLHRPSRIIQDDVVEELSYDALDRVIVRKKLAHDGTLLSASFTKYDTAGRIIEEKIAHTAGKATTKTAYGAYGLVESIAYPDGTSTQYSYIPIVKGPNNHHFFKKITTDPQGVTTEELLDANDQVVSAIVKDPFGKTIAKVVKTFNILSKPVCISEEAIAHHKRQGCQITKLQYDSIGQLISCTFAEGAPEQSTYQYRYDSAGRKIEEKKPSGTTLTSSYDSLSRLKKLCSSDGTIHYVYQYNVQGLPESVFNKVSHTKTVRHYDGFGHITSETFENGLSLSYDITPRGLLSSIAYPDGSTSSYRYSSGRLSSIRRKACKYTVVSRDLCGIITRAKLPISAGEILYSMDLMGRWHKVQHPHFTEERTLFTPVGLCQHRLINSHPETFSYDYLGQLTDDNGKKNSYDSLYRRLESSGVQAAYASNRLISFGSSTFRYDKDGRRTKDAHFTYSYDALDRLTSIKSKDCCYEYRYDAFNRRLSSKGSSKEELFFWHGDIELGSCDASKNIKSLRILGEGLKKDVGASVLFELDNVPFIPLHDLSGNVRALLDTNGSLIEEISYSAFGPVSSSRSPWTYASKRQDPESSLIYFGARFYDPQTASWLSQDPLGYLAGPNLYAYAKNNPLTNLDVFGLLEESSSRGFFGWISDCFHHDVEQQTIATHALDAPRQDSEQVALAPREISLENGQKIIEGVHYPNQVLCYPQGNDLFLEKFAGQNLGFGVACLTRGIDTTLYEACASSERMQKEARGLVTVIILYNATEGMHTDFFEAAANSVGMELKVGKDLEKQFTSLLDACLASDIKFDAKFYAHSQGAAINKNLFAHVGFQDGGKYSDFVNARVNFGGAVIDPRATNYIATRDPVGCYACAMYYARAGVGLDERGADIRYLHSNGETPISSHYFDHAPYRGALEAQLQEAPR